MLSALLALLRNILLIPLMWLTKAFANYTQRKNYDRAEKRLISIIYSTENFETWRHTARRLDNLRGLETWKFEKSQSDYINSEAIVEETRHIVKLYNSRNIAGTGHYLRTELSRSGNGLLNPLLYRYYTGTKVCVEEYIFAVCALIDFFAGKELPEGDLNMPSELTYKDGCRKAHNKEVEKFGEYMDDVEECTGDLSIEERFRTLKEASRSYGRSALMLSGGASLGVYHAGVIRALFSASVLPEVITGSSAGAILGSILCTRSDEEMEELIKNGSFDFTMLYLDAFEEIEDTKQSIDNKMKRMYHSGAFMDVETLIGMLKNNFGNMTFEEAYQHSRRVLNVSVASLREGEHQDRAMLLNYISTPNVVLWSAVCASCAMPGLFTAVQLMEKLSDDSIVPYLENQKFFDGSVARDIPKEGIATMFNVNYFIVSQVNPHVIPFIRPSPSPLLRKRGASLLLSFWFSACEESRYWLQKLYRFNILPKTGGAAIPYLVATQSYVGDLTIFPIGNPASALPDYINLISNPSPEYLQYVTAKAQQRTWPFLNQIFYTCQIERKLQESFKAIRKELKDHYS